MLKRGVTIIKDGRDWQVTKVSKIKDTIMLLPEGEKQQREYTLSNLIKNIEAGRITIKK
jgi:hypothetical protein